jgi:hemerythrin superfamily protein
MSTSVTQLVVCDHRKVQGHIDAYNKEVGPEKRQALVHEMIRDLSIHSSCEELVLYPFIKLHVGETAAKQLLDEQVATEQLLYELDNMKVGDPGFQAKFDTMVKNLLLHMKEEEEEIFPLLEKQVSDTKLKELGSEWLEKKKIAPTRPHPSAPKSGLAAVAAALAAKPIDELKDAMRFSDQQKQEHKAASQQPTS